MLLGSAGMKAMEITVGHGDLPDGGLPENATKNGLFYMIRHLILFHFRIPYALCIVYLHLGHLWEKCR